MEIVRFINKETSRTLNLRHDEHGDLAIAPGEERVLPLDYIAVAFGHPNAQDMGKLKHREKAVKSAYRYWGFYPGLESEIGPWENFAPKYEVYSMQGDRLYTPLEDPAGVKGAAVANTGPKFQDPNVAVMANEMDQLKVMIAKQQEMIQQLVSQGAASANTSPVAPTSRDAEVSGDDLARAMQQVAQSNQNPAAEIEIPKPPANSDIPSDDRPRTNRAGRRNG